MELTHFFDAETGQNYLISYSRELSGNEMSEAVEQFKPSKIMDLHGRDFFYIIADGSWKPKAKP